MIGLIDSGGARIRKVSTAWPPTASSSGAIPRPAGPSADQPHLGAMRGRGGLLAGLTDFVIMTKGTGQMFITGPEVIKAVTGEQVIWRLSVGPWRTAPSAGGPLCHRR